jgi:hypothetical protein
MQPSRDCRDARSGSELKGDHELRTHPGLLALIVSVCIPNHRLWNRREVDRCHHRLVMESRVGNCLGSSPPAQIVMQERNCVPPMEPKSGQQADFCLRLRDCRGMSRPAFQLGLRGRCVLTVKAHMTSPVRFSAPGAMETNTGGAKDAFLASPCQLMVCGGGPIACGDGIHAQMGVEARTDRALFGPSGSEPNQRQSQPNWEGFDWPLSEAEAPQSLPTAPKLRR